MLMLLALWACRTAPAPADVPLDTDATTATSLTGAATTAGATGETASPTTGSTSATATTAHTGTTASTASTAHTGTTPREPPCPPTGHTGAITGATGDTSTTCGELDPDARPVCFETEPITDFGPTCVSDTAAPPIACPTFDWALRGTGPSSQSALATTLLPDGDLILVGGRTAELTLAPGRPDQVILPAPPTLFSNGWMARVTPDGELRWAVRMIEASGVALAKDIQTMVNGDLLLHGSAGAESLVRPGTPGAVTLYADSVSGQWWGVFDADADVAHAHVIQGIEAPYGSHENVSITSMHASPDGTIYLEGSFDQGIVFNAGEPDEHTLTTGNDGEQWLAAWGPDGDFRWVRIEEDVRALYFRAVSDGIRVFHTQYNTQLWGACTPYETTISPHVDPVTGLPQNVQVVATYDAMTGELSSAPETTPITHYLATWTDEQSSHQYGSFGTAMGHPVAINGRLVPPSMTGLHALDEDFVAQQPMVLKQDDNSMTVATRTIMANDALVVTAGTLNYPNGITTQWECGPALDLPPYVPTGSSDSHTVYYTFTPDLEPQCVGTFGMSGGDVDGLIDQEGGLVFTSTITQPYTFGAGQPNEVTITPDQGDALLVRFAPP